MRHFHQLVLALAALAAISLCSAASHGPRYRQHQARSTWPASDLMEPTDFKAYRVGQIDSCPTLIQFKRDAKDGRYNYNVTETTSSGTKQLKQYITYSSNQPLSVVDATAQGQRGVYKIDGGYTLLPFQVYSCPSDATYHVEAYEGSKKVWTSPAFTLTKKLVPLGSPSVKSAMSADGSKITVNWSYDQASSVKGYFVIAGQPSAKTISSTYVSGGSSTTATVDVGTTDLGSVAVTVNTYDGSITGSPTACEQIGVN